MGKAFLGVWKALRVSGDAGMTGRRQLLIKGNCDFLAFLLSESTLKQTGMVIMVQICAILASRGYCGGFLTLWKAERPLFGRVSVEIMKIMSINHLTEHFDSRVTYKGRVLASISNRYL